MIESWTFFFFLTESNQIESWTKVSKMDEKKEIGSESDTKSGAGKEIMGALSQFDQLMVLLLFRKKKKKHSWCY